MKSSGFIRHLMLGTLLSAVLFAVAAPIASAQHGAGDMKTLEEMKRFLRDEGRSRDLSQLTHEELANLSPSPGGMVGNLFATEFVFKIGTSTFIVNMLAIFLVILIAGVVVIFFFTPIGLFLFRGSLHAFAGAILKGTGISNKFGEHLMKEPKKWLQKEKSVRQAFALYMHNEFIPEYKNNITAIAFIGTAFLILNIGLRGVKFMTAHQPDLIVIAIVVEITVLLLLGLTTWYEKEEEEEAGAGAGMPGKQLTLSEVERRLDALKDELEASVRTETGMRP
ncbi:MAG: hypothetical protein C0600_10155 [Ignavibacteria bacterium]|nr:MAG: hypothetical protein C0600_10155 [Ignavibacteria bacterium]